MHRTGFALALLLVAGLGWSGRALGQAEHYGRPYELNLHAGALIWDSDFPDDFDTELLLGARIVLNQRSGWGFGGNFDWTQITLVEDGSEVDMTTYLYSAEIDYTFASPSRTHPFVGIGVGAATFKPEEGDSDTHLLIPLVGGIKYFNRTNDSSWAFRVEVRDNIIRVSNGDSEITHNWEISGGISFLFGS